MKEGDMYRAGSNSHNTQGKNTGRQEDTKEALSIYIKTGLLYKQRKYYPELTLN